jgi:hypothetical protein
MVIDNYGMSFIESQEHSLTFNLKPSSNQHTLTTHDVDAAWQS